MNNSLVLQNRLAYYRCKLDLTQSELAEIVGVSKNTISSIECGYESPNVGLALIISHVLGVSLDTLFYLKFKIQP